jgi:hypothetical protein
MVNDPKRLYVKITDQTFLKLQLLFKCFFCTLICFYRCTKCVHSLAYHHHHHHHHPHHGFISGIYGTERECAVHTKQKLQLSKPVVSTTMQTKAQLYCYCTLPISVEMKMMHLLV